MTTSKIVSDCIRSGPHLAQQHSDEGDDEVREMAPKDEQDHFELDHDHGESPRPPVERGPQVVVKELFLVYSTLACCLIKK